MKPHVHGWFRSNAAAEREHTLPGERWVMDAYHDRITLVERNGEGTDNRYIHVIVTGRSSAHIDRLARDWIGHGVAPAANGNRGVASEPAQCSCRPWWTTSENGRREWRHDLECADVRWGRAEARAARVVVR